MIDTLYIQPQFGGREVLKSMVAAPKIGLNVQFGGKFDLTRMAPLGSVEFCESLLGYSPKPDFYPDFLSGWLHRKIRTQELKIADGEIFIKSAERYKAFPARTYHTGETLPDGILIISEVCRFTKEWRCYVAGGKLLCDGVYDGPEEFEQPPNLNIQFPEWFSGAVDFGTLESGETAIVESHHPYACGWYGDDHEAYVRWVVNGWEYLVGAKSGD